MPAFLLPGETPIATIKLLAAGSLVSKHYSIYAAHVAMVRYAYGHPTVREFTLDMAAAGYLNFDIDPTPGGFINWLYRDGDDSGATAPSDPVLGQPVAVGTTQLDIPLAIASTGGSAPITYVLERSPNGSTSWTQIASGATIFNGTNGYSDTGLTANTTYYYRTKAVGSDARESLYSNVANGTTNAVVGDTTPPSAISGSPQMTVTNITSTTADVQCGTATDNVAVVAYRLWLGVGDGAGNPVGSAVVVGDIPTLASAPYTITGLTASQQRYVRAQALDAAGNAGATTDPRIFFTTAASGNPGEPTDPPTGTLIATYDWANGIGLGNTDQSGTLPSGLFVSGNYPRLISTVNRESGAYSMYSPVNKDTSFVSYRTEVSELSNYAYQQTYWIGWSTYFPTNHAFSNVYSGPFFQIHGEPFNWNEPDVGNQPIWWIALTDNDASQGPGRWQVRQNSAHVAEGSGQIASMQYFGADFGDGNTANIFGKWVDFALQIRFDWRRIQDGGTGFSKLYCNGVLSADIPSPCGFNDAGPYLKWGNYKASWRNGPISDIISFRAYAHGPVRIGGSDCNYAKVKPVGSRPSQSVAFTTS